MNHIPLRLINTLTGIKEIFKPLHDAHVTMYVCGITPYDAPHVGHARVYVTFDLLYRLLLAQGYTVSYCRNFTDIDDKLLNKAKKVYGDQMFYHKIATTYIEQFHQDIDALNCKRPTYEPRVTDHIPEIIAFVQNLVDQQKAYAVEGDVYFAIDSSVAYGKLSKQKIEELNIGARINPNEKKRSPLDFALWKSEAANTFWQSPWGWGRPGWHIECSALAYTYLGKQIDIHAGGADLIFPHHENEIAQTEARTNLPFSTFWLHNAFVQINKEKMSKSLGNFFTIQELFQKIDPMVLRFMLLNHHYRSPIDFTLDDFEGLEKAYQRLIALSDYSLTPCNHTEHNELFIQELLAVLADDLNTVGVFGLIFKNIKEIQNNPDVACATKNFLQNIFGLTLKPLQKETVALTPQIESLLREREEARTAKDWQRADQLRDQLKALGFSVQDKKSS